MFLCTPPSLHNMYNNMYICKYIIYTLQMYIIEVIIISIADVEGVSLFMLLFFVLGGMYGTTIPSK
jgi:hypothetical protein